MGVYNCKFSIVVLLNVFFTCVSLRNLTPHFSWSKTPASPHDLTKVVLVEILIGYTRNKILPRDEENTPILFVRGVAKDQKQWSTYYGRVQSPTRNLFHQL